MTSAERDLYARGKQLVSGPKPFPLLSGFSTGHPHRAFGSANARAAKDAYFVLRNDSEEIWFSCNCHVRAHALQSDGLTFRLSNTKQTRNPAALV